MVYSGAQDILIHEKKLKSKISSQTIFEVEQGEFFELWYFWSVTSFFRQNRAKLIKRQHKRLDTQWNMCYIKTVLCR